MSFPRPRYSGPIGLHLFQGFPILDYRQVCLRGDNAVFQRAFGLCQETQPRGKTAVQKTPSPNRQQPKVFSRSEPFDPRTPVLVFELFGNSMRWQKQNSRRYRHPLTTSFDMPFTTVMSCTLPVSSATRTPNESASLAIRGNKPLPSRSIDRNTSGIGAGYLLA